MLRRLLLATLAFTPVWSMANTTIELNPHTSVQGNGFWTPGSTTVITSGFGGTTTVYTNGKNGQQVTTFKRATNTPPLNFIRSNNLYYNGLSYLDSIDYSRYVFNNSYLATQGNLLDYDYSTNKVSYKPYVFVGTAVGTWHSNVYGRENFSTSVMGTGITLPFAGGRLGLEVRVSSPSYDDDFWRRRW
ncbi:hypothetical protein [Psittacicella gerlachiana]|uniref:Uncharacterized protein n=1 Tax=Psittacicella gerlachiana TaxID=2028574 RepID=A0A3A1YEJ3_9GAMM|nr:hypothetical protein [Psittacicella gerlachiana]RIY35578.1 hypothetical protein CKF59_03465 [Psittacicella gerlachiana]